MPAAHVASLSHTGETERAKRKHGKHEGKKDGIVMEQMQHSFMVTIAILHPMSNNTEHPAHIYQSIQGLAKVALN